MHFLMNDQVIEVGDPNKALQACRSLLTEVPLQNLRPQDAVALGQATFFSLPPRGRPDPMIAKALAALLNAKTEANAALFVKPVTAQSHSDVLVRLADIPLPTLAYLKAHQRGEALDPNLVNQSVWSSAA